MSLRLLTYVRIPAAIGPWDPKLPDVAALLAASIRDVAPDLVPEHIGSSEGDPEIHETRAFRDALRADPELRARYEAKKREILAAGITDGMQYAEMKGEAVVEALRRLGLR